MNSVSVISSWSMYLQSMHLPQRYASFWTCSRGSNGFLVSSDTLHLHYLSGVEHVVGVHDVLELPEQLQVSRLFLEDVHRERAGGVREEPAGVRQSRQQLLDGLRGAFLRVLDRVLDVDRRAPLDRDDHLRDPARVFEGRLSQRCQLLDASEGGVEAKRFLRRVPGAAESLAHRLVQLCLAGDRLELELRGKFLDALLLIRHEPRRALQRERDRPRRKAGVITQHVLCARLAEDDDFGAALAPRAPLRERARLLAVGEAHHDDVAVLRLGIQEDEAAQRKPERIARAGEDPADVGAAVLAPVCDRVRQRVRPRPVLAPVGEHHVEGRELLARETNRWKDHLALERALEDLSYTHLTLPTNREVE